MSAGAAASAGAAPPLIVVFNIGAGHGRADEVRQVLTDGCAEAGRTLELLEAQDPKRLTAVARQAVSRARECAGVVVAAGGDGTINTVAQATLGSGCGFGVLPQGTFNYFSRAHGIPADTRQALQVLLAGHHQPVQVGRVGNRVFLVNASLGLYPELLQDREAWKRRFGRSRVVAFWAGIVTLLRGHPSLRLTIESQGRERELRTPTLFVGNNALQLEQMGLPEAGAVDAGMLAAIALRPVSRLQMLGLLVRGALGRLGEADDLIHIATPRLVVRARRRLRALRGQRIKVATDGEVTWMRLPLTFEVAAQTLELLRPPALAPERHAEATGTTAERTAAA